MKKSVWVGPDLYPVIERDSLVLGAKPVQIERPGAKSKP